MFCNDRGKFIFSTLKMVSIEFSRIITLNEPYTSSADVMIRAHKQHVTIVRKSESSVVKKRKKEGKLQTNTYTYISYQINRS